MVGVRKFSASSINSKAEARFVPQSVVLATEPFAIVTGLHRPSAELRREANGHVLRAKQFLGERFNILDRNPARAQPRINFGGRQIFRLNRFQRLDIFVKAGFVDAGDFGGLKFFADIAGKIMVFRFPFRDCGLKNRTPFNSGRKSSAGRANREAMCCKSTRPFSFSEMMTASFGDSADVIGFLLLDGALAENAPS